MKKLITLLLLGVAAICVDAQTFEYNGLKYKILNEEEKTCEVTRNFEVPSNVTIPETVTYNDTQYAVISIEEWAFYGCSLFAVTLPEGITSIGDQAFCNCRSLTSITFPESLNSIGMYAFGSCTSLIRVEISNIESWCKIDFSDVSANPLCYANSLFLNGTEVKDLVIPKSVTSIGKYAFSYCTGLSSVTFSENIISVGKEAFLNCTGLTKVEISDIAAWCKINFESYDSNPLYYARNLYLNGNEVKELVIPNSVTSIGNYSFSGCLGLTNVEIPTSITSIGRGAFYECTGLTRLVYKAEKCTYAGEDYYPTNNVSEGTLWLYGCSNLSEVEIGDNVKEIPVFFLSFLNSLKNIKIPTSVTSISVYAFYNCTGLTSISLPESLTSIGRGSFNSCTGLKSINLPASLTSIGEDAFCNCKNLRIVNSNSTNPPVCGDNEVFYGVPSDAELHVPVGTKDDYASATGWSKFNIIIDDLTNEVGVDEIETDGSEADEIIVVYNLQGVKLNINSQDELNRLTPGLYIVNGKKIIVK